MFLTEKEVINMQAAVLVGGKPGEGCRRLWQAFSEGEERRSLSALQRGEAAAAGGGHESPRPALVVGAGAWNHVS